MNAKMRFHAKCPCVSTSTRTSGNRTTPSHVEFTDDRLMIGDAAKNQTAINVKNTVFDANRLIGRRFSDLVDRDDLKHWSVEVVCGAGGKLRIQVGFNGETKQFMPDEIPIVVLTKMRDPAEAFIGKEVKNAVVTCQRTSTTRSVRRRRTWA